MKKLIATFMMMAIMAIMLPLTANAQTRNGRYNSRRSTVTQKYERPNVYDRHRNVINVAAGTGIGTLLGALIGGKKGALIGAAAGAGGSALYTYKINPKNRRYYRRNY